MSRPSIPSAIQDAKGYYLKHPERARPDEPPDDRPIGPPPAWLNAKQSKVWRDLAIDLLPGVGKQSDRTAFEQLVRLVTAMRSNEPMMAADRTAMVSLLARFGMTPSDRSKVSAEPTQKSALDSFLKRQPPTPPGALN